jgi:hypothetical protein
VGGRGRPNLKPGPVALSYSAQQALMLLLARSYVQRHVQNPRTEKRKKHGDAGYRSPCLSHAKRALYHLSYIPILLSVFVSSSRHYGSAHVDGMGTLRAAALLDRSLTSDPHRRLLATNAWAQQAQHQPGRIASHRVPRTTARPHCTAAAVPGPGPEEVDADGPADARPRNVPI